MPVNHIFSALWTFFQPMLFGLIGSEVDVTEIQPKTIGMYSVFCCLLLKEIEFLK